MWVIDFWHPCSWEREVRVFDTRKEAYEKLDRWQPFEPVVWQLY